MIGLNILTVYSGKILQTALNENAAEPKLKVDGICGNKTVAAFVAFQARNNIPFTDPLDEVLESLGIGYSLRLKKLKRNIKIEKNRPSQTEIPEEDREGNSKVRKTIELPANRGQCFKNKLWIDGAIKGPNVVAKSAYKTATGRPIGAVIHFTAGWNKRGAAAKSLSSTKYGFNCIDIEMGVFQPKNLPLNKYGNHAGTSAAFLVGYGKTKSCSNKMIGYEINCGGKLSPGDQSKGQNPSDWYTWFAKKVAKENRRYLSKTTDNYGPKGWYEMYSDKQEQDLVDVLVWHCLNDSHFKWQNIYAHHEVSGNKFIGRFRKSDPGGSLSYDMEELRRRVHRKVEEVLAT